MTIEECLQHFGNEFRNRLSSDTIYIYQTAVEQMVMYCDKPFDQLKARDIRSWMDNLGENSYKNTTIKNKLAGLKLFFGYCVEEKLITQNPALSIPFPAVDEPDPHYLQEEHLNQLRLLVESNSEERAIVELLYCTGMRISEMVNIKKEDINWSERYIEIPKAKRKKARIVLFTRACAEYLRVHLQGQNEAVPYVFVNKKGIAPMGMRNLQYKFNAYAKKLGTQLTPHTLRHTFAANLAMKGMPLECIQDLLGHDSGHQTQVYSRLYNKARKQMYDQWM